MQRTRIRLAILGAAVLAGAAVYVAHLQKPNQSKVDAPRAATGASTHRHPSLLPGVVTSESAHYRIHSTATAQQTAQVAQAVETLYGRYISVFPAPERKAEKLTLVLYRNRAEFKHNNHSRPWAEAYHLPPRSYAYFDATARNPYHWMLHEATHQLMREVSAFPRAKWIDEGVASYFGSSRLAEDALRLGDADPDAYPIWWLPNFELSGVLEDDIAAGRIIPLKQVISGKDGPDVDRYFNQYYIHYWSLSHFLFHYRDGVYAQRYRQLIAEGGSLDRFTRLIGPPERIQREWYVHLRGLTRASADEETFVSYGQVSP